MSIKNRTIISLLLSFFLILGIIIFATNMVINSSFEDLETNTILSKLRSLRSGLEQEQKELEKTVRDWAHWDDMRDYVNHYNPSFIQSNISESLFQNYNLNHVAIIDTDFRVVYAAAYDQYDEVYQDLSGIGFNYLEQMVPDLKSMQPADYLSFTLKTSSGPMMLVFMPILDSSAQGPVNGYFMMGRIM
ncbi:MAG TPA: CHASE4 domain-containing protein, partial [Candidatus Cloacimonadota bacterium]|nr:CHASE4 domain-containing protein [Candidatus Cloacimonadota bacterium]